MPIATPAKVSRSISRTLRNGVLMLHVGVCLGTVAADAQDATWGSAPATSNWSTAANWSPTTAVPTGTATFDQSTKTTIGLSQNATIGTLQFNGGAPAYTFNVSGAALQITGFGIANSSSNSPTINLASFGALTEFGGMSTASTAGNATITTSSHGQVQFVGPGTAGNATITNNFSGRTNIIDGGTAGSATITTNSNGLTEFVFGSAAGSANLTTNTGGLTEIVFGSTAGSANITTNAGGQLIFSGTEFGGTNSTPATLSSPPTPGDSRHLHRRARAAKPASSPPLAAF